MKTPKFIAYYRVSTDRQGRSGLGLEAQRQAVCDFLAGRGELIESFETVAGILRLWWTGRTFPFILPVQPFSEEGQL
jgi:hypothetical protein